MITLSDLDYPLPKELIAQRPLRERSASRLLVLDRERALTSHRKISDLPELMPPALWVFNDTRVFPARLTGRKSTGGRVELLLVERIETQGEQERWVAMGRASKPLSARLEVFFDATLRATVLRPLEEGLFEVELKAEGSVMERVEELGQVPLPPYIERQADVEDEQRYQTVFAQHTGAVAAPTAGLHFSEELINALQARGHQIAFLTLHVGPGTFRPVKSESLDSHQMHCEHYAISTEVADQINACRAEDRPVIAVGTTVVRALESSWDEAHGVLPGERQTSLFIKPPHQFRVVDALLTNFHLPKSTLLALVMAFGGVDALRAAYAEAVHERYRFFSYGDAMLIAQGMSA